MLPVASPAHAVQISPEALEVANVYLGCNDIYKVATELSITPDAVSDILDRKEVRAYIDAIFLDVGFNNKFKIRQVMDALISKKLEELDEAEIGSSKDITELLALSHKMTMEYMDKQIQLEKLRQGSVKTQVNIQNNGPTNYGDLIEKLLRG